MSIQSFVAHRISSDVRQARHTDKKREANPSATTGTTYSISRKRTWSDWLGEYVMTFDSVAEGLHMTVDEANECLQREFVSSHPNRRRINELFIHLHSDRRNQLTSGDCSRIGGTILRFPTLGKLKLVSFAVNKQKVFGVLFYSVAYSVTPIAHCEQYVLAMWYAQEIHRIRGRPISKLIRCIAPSAGGVPNDRWRIQRKLRIIVLLSLGQWLWRPSIITNCRSFLDQEGISATIAFENIWKHAKRICHDAFQPERYVQTRFCWRGKCCLVDICI